MNALSIVDALEASHGPGGGLGHLRSRPRPVGRPRRPVPSRPTAASRRRPRLQLRRRARAAAEAADRQGEFSPGRSVSLSSERAREGGRVVDLQSWSVSSRVVCARLGLWGSGDPGRGNWASGPCSRLVFCHGRCMCVPVGTAPSSSCASLRVSRSLRLSRLGSRAVWNRRWLDEAARCYHARATSARGALCACFGGWGCGAF